MGVWGPWLLSALVGYPFSPVSFAAVSFDSVAGELSGSLVPKRGSTYIPKADHFWLVEDWHGVTATQKWVQAGPCGTAVLRWPRRQEVHATRSRHAVVPKPSSSMWRTNFGHSQQPSAYERPWLVQLWRNGRKWITSEWDNFPYPSLKEWASMTKSSYRQGELQRRFVRAVTLRGVSSLPKSHWSLLTS